jgi:hypothetical protein
MQPIKVKGQRFFFCGASNGRPSSDSVQRRFRVVRTTFVLGLAGFLAMLVAAQGQPAIVASVPPNGAMDVSGTAPVIFKFNTNMNPAMTLAQFFDDTASYGTIPSWSADARWLTNTPIGAFPAGKTITWFVFGRSASNEILDGVTTGTFTIGSGGVTIVSVIPASGTTGVSLTAPVVFTFSTNMNKSATMAQFLNASVPPPNTLAMTADWNTDGTRLTNTPNAPFPPNKAISWVVFGEDTLGNAVVGTQSGTFMTGGTNGPPTLLSTTPANHATGVLTNAPVLFTFNVAMDTDLTTAEFYEASAPSQSLPFTASWSEDMTILMCEPTPAFPAGKVIVWSIQGQGATGAAFAGATGSFTTSGGTNGQGNTSFSAVLSRGELAEQTDTNLWQITGQEFMALSGAPASGGVLFAAPMQVTNILTTTGIPGAMEFADHDAEPVSFATNYPAGDYLFLFDNSGSVSSATIPLTDGLLPAAPRLFNWQSPPRAVLAQPLSLQWTWDAGGAPVDYVRVRIEQDGSAVYASPLPDGAGALTAASNSIVVPAGIFTNAGLADVSITAFSFTAHDTNSIPGVTLHAARHRTTTFELSVVDGTTPPPLLLTTNLVGVPVGEAVMYPLRTTNGAGPKQFTKIGGLLPSGLTLGSEGTLEGQASSAGTFNATLRLTDLLGHSTTQSLQVVTVPVTALATPALENVGRGNGATVRFDLVGGAGADCQIERSTNLINWNAYVTTNPPSDRLSVQVPIDSRAAFFRVRGPGSPPTPHPLTVAPVLNSNVTASAELDSFGGTLALTNASGYVFTLNVPPGALDWPETITMTDVASIGGLPLSGGLRAAVDLQPEGLTFNLPARLDIMFPTPLNTNAVLGFSALSGGQEFALDYLSISNRTVSLNLLHFTMGGAGEGTGSDAQAQSQNTPDDPMAAADQETEAARQECLLADCDPSSHSEELRKLYVQYADQTVLPKLKQAGQDPSDAVLDDAIYTWLEWLRKLQLLELAEGSTGEDQSGSELGKRMIRATGLASKAVSNGITKACQDCLNHDIWRTARMLSLGRLAQLLGWDYDNKVFECIRKCLVFELKIESEIVDRAPNGMFMTHTKATAKLKPMGSDAGEQEWAQIVLKMFTGTGTWDITEVQNEAGCPITSAPSSGRIVLPVVKIHLYKERTSYIPGKGKLVSYVFDPDLEVNLCASLSLMPGEGRVIHCPKVGPQPVGDFFGPFFLGLHASEYVFPQPGSLEADVLGGGPVVRMKGFQQSGAGNVIFAKPYFKTDTDGESVVTENTLVELRHTPK